MNKKFLTNAVLSAIIIIVFAGFFPGKDDIYFEVSKNIDLFGRVYKEISFNYVDQIDPEEFMRAGIKGMLHTLDPYTIFIDENKKNDIELITNGKYGGVGISIGVRGDQVTVVEVLDGYSAQRQGIRIGDIITEAGGVHITPENVEDISTLVKGDPGSSVELKVLRNDEQDTLKFNLIREEVIVKSLTYAGFYPENSNNVYLKLTSFSRSAGDEIKHALKELKSEKEIKSIVLDLRGNPGGLLDVAVDICDKFLPKGSLIVTTKGRDKDSEKKYFAEQEPMVGKAKLIVLVNGNSASASEIVAGAMQDQDRGVILGTKSFGKGLVQTITPLDFNTSLKITTAKYYTPSGRCIQKIDYSKKNDVIASADSIIQTEFFTMHKRPVYSAGGITPDSVVEYKIDGDITKELLAKGFFFNFADHYYYLNPKKEFSSFKDENLFKEFGNYIGKNNFVYHSEAEKEIDKLIKEVTENKLDSKISSELENVKKDFEKVGDKALQIHKQEIIREIKRELVSRYLGNEGKMDVTLSGDPQVQSALSILSHNEVYYKLLNLN